MLSEFVKESIDKTLKMFDKNFLVLHAVEEMSELQKELLKNVNRSKDNVDDIFSELCDVYVYIEIMKKLYNFSDFDINERLDKKSNEWIKKHSAL